MAVKRGDVVCVAVRGDYGKPCPAVVLQSDLFDEHPSLTVLPITSDLRDAPAFRLDLPSDESRMSNIDRALAVFPGIA